MKITKAQRSEFDKAIKKKAKDYGCKYAYGVMFSQIGENFTYTLCGLTVNGEVCGHIHIKKMSYDNLFWDIINMPNNRLQPLSFRANAAFKSPSILLPLGGIMFDEDLDMVANQCCSAVAATVNSFLDNNSVGEYVLTKESSPYAPVLKCLEYLDRNDTAAALEIAYHEIALGNCGGFSNEGKTFFEWVVYRYNT